MGATLRNVLSSSGEELYVGGRFYNFVVEKKPTLDQEQIELESEPDLKEWNGRLIICAHGCLARTLALILAPSSSRLICYVLLL